MHNSTEIFLLLLVSVCVIAAIANRINLSPPIACVIGGMALALVPGFPEFQIPPNLILLIFLPVLLTEAAYLTSIRDFKNNLRPIAQMAFGLVIFTTVAVAAAMQWLFPGIGWAVGMVMGAIISPPDAVAATSVIKNLHIPRRAHTILEGESLVNDATGIVLYRFAVAAVVTGSFSLAQASSHFLWMVSSGIAIGWVGAMAYIKCFRFIKEESVEILSTFLVPYAVYIATEELHGSGVMAVVTSGIVTGWFSPRYFTSKFRLQANAVWKMTIFVMNGLVFLLIGLYFPHLATQLSYINLLALGKAVAVITLVIIAARFLWVYIVGYGQVFFLRKLSKKYTYSPWQNVFLVGWTGMRGVVSLATALALPLTVADGSPFPYRDMIIFISFAVIVVTLVLQGITLPWLIKALPLTYDMQHLNEDWQARKEAADKAMARLQEIQFNDDDLGAAALKRIISHYCDRLRALGDGPNTPLDMKQQPVRETHPIIDAENRIWQDILEIERKTILDLRHDFKISDEVMHDILREIDLMDSRFTSLG